MPFIEDLAGQAAGAAGSLVGTGLGLMLEKHNDKRQLAQQQKLQQMQIQGQMQMGDYNLGNQMKLWEQTGYQAQGKQMEAAGLNKGLMYGMGGGGGQTAAAQPGNVSGGQAPQGGHEIQGQIGLQLQHALMDAQRRNIDADTKIKNAGAIKTGEEGLKLQYENVINDLITNTDLDGNGIQEGEDAKRTGFQSKVADIRAKQAETLKNNETLKKIAEEIELMKKQGSTQEQIKENLQKDGQLKDMEIEWSKMGLTRESLTKFIQLLIIKAL